MNGGRTLFSGTNRDQWTQLKLNDLCVHITSGGTPSRRVPTYYIDGVYPWVKTQELCDTWINDTEEHITPEAIAQSSAKILPKNTVLVAMYGATVGKLGLLRQPMTCNQACCALIVDDQKADYRFIFYHLLQDRDRLKNLATGAAQQNLSGEVIKSLKFWIPPLPEQRRIAHILGTLDDKIENNRKTAKTLEAMAQAIFKSWFVDFDPVRAKMAGESRESICKRLKLTPEILDLFPDRLVDSELGEIPEGWSYSRLGDVADVNWGNTRVTKRFYVNQGYLAYSATGPDGFLPYYEHDHVGVVVSAIGANSGYTWLALGKWSTIKNTIRFWSDSADMNTEYLYLATHNINFWPLRGSAQPFISQTDARNTKILHPSKNLAKVFGESASKLFQVVHQKERKSQYLIHLRDTLLPKLISGEIRVSDAQAVVDTTANASKLFHD